MKELTQLEHDKPFHMFQITRKKMLNYELAIELKVSKSIFTKKQSRIDKIKKIRS